MTHQLTHLAWPAALSLSTDAVAPITLRPPPPYACSPLTPTLKPNNFKLQGRHLNLLALAGGRVTIEDFFYNIAISSLKLNFQPDPWMLLDLFFQTFTVWQGSIVLRRMCIQFICNNLKTAGLVCEVTCPQKLELHCRKDRNMTKTTT